MLLFISGCSSNWLKKSTCTLHREDLALGYDVDSLYEIYYLGNTVDHVKTIESISSENKEILVSLKASVSSTYDRMNSLYGGYSYKISESKNKITVTTTIDYNKVDIAKLSNELSEYSEIINNNKITYSGLTNMYIGIGATCD